MPLRDDDVSVIGSNGSIREFCRGRGVCEGDSDGSDGSGDSDDSDALVGDSIGSGEWSVIGDRSRSGSRVNDGG